MRIGFIGRTEIMYDLICAVAKFYEIAFISTSKEAPEYLKSAKDFKELAELFRVKFLYAPRISTPENIAFMKECGEVDIVLSVNHTSIVEKEVIDLFPLGILNLHGGDLPRYRGNACQAWAILNGESRIGLCVHKMEGGKLDSGDIIAREYLEIDINTKVTDCLAWIKQMSIPMFLSALEKLSVDKNYILAKQNQNIKPLRCYPRNPEDGRIDWRKSNIEILRLINASNKPYSGAFCFYKQEKVIVWDAELYFDDEEYLSNCGQVSVWGNGGAVVICGVGKLKLKTIEYKGTIMNADMLLCSIRNRLC